MPPTLLVIDLQQGLVEGDPSGVHRSTPNLTRNVTHILTRWRHHAWPIIHIHHDDADPSHPLRQDHPDTSRAHACAVPLPREQIFYKGVGSAFVASRFEEEGEGFVRDWDGGDEVRYE
jgi:nicotinamidase-related amidase